MGAQRRSYLNLIWDVCSMGRRPFVVNIDIVRLEPIYDIIYKIVEIHDDTIALPREQSGSPQLSNMTYADHSLNVHWIRVLVWVDLVPDIWDIIYTSEPCNQIIKSIGTQNSSELQIIGHRTVVFSQGRSRLWSALLW